MPKAKTTNLKALVTDPSPYCYPPFKQLSSERFDRIIEPLKSNAFSKWDAQIVFDVREKLSSCSLPEPMSKQQQELYSKIEVFTEKYHREHPCFPPGFDFAPIGVVAALTAMRENNLNNRRWKKQDAINFAQVIKGRCVVLTGASEAEQMEWIGFDIRWLQYVGKHSDVRRALDPVYLILHQVPQNFAATLSQLPHLQAVNNCSHLFLVTGPNVEEQMTRAAFASSFIRNAHPNVAMYVANTIALRQW